MKGICYVYYLIGGLPVHSLTNELLIEAFIKAQKLQLNEDFIHLLREEMQLRGMDVDATRLERELNNS